MAQKTILVTGATGLLGSNLLKHLLEKNYLIYALRRPNSDLSACPKDPRINWLITTDLSINFWNGIPGPIDYIIHAAGLVSYNKKDKNLLFDINRDFTKKLAEDALKNKVEKFIFISSISALGKNSQNGIIVENTRHNNDHFNSNYGESKREAERELKLIGEKGLNWIILNPSVIIGAAKPDQSSARLIYYVADKKPFYTEGSLNYVGVDDVSNVITNSLDDKWKYKQWIVSAGAMSYKTFFQETAKHLNTRAPFIKIPKSGVIAGAFLENIWSKISGKTPTLSIETAKMAGKKHIYSNKLVKKEMNFEFSTFEQVLGKAVKEMKEREFLK